MVIGKTFVWGHLPKTGGDATARLFSLFPDLLLHVDAYDGNEKHAVFHNRESDVSGKQVLLNIRRLPDWLLSYAHHVNQRGLWPDYKPEPMWSPFQIATSSIADETLRLYTNDGHREVGWWFRTEYLVEDFCAFISTVVEIDSTQYEKIAALGRVNEHEYDHDLSHWFTDVHLALMYEKNPFWADVEERTYETSRKNLNHPGGVLAEQDFSAQDFSAQ